MIQTPMQKFESKCSKARLYVQNDMSLGDLHDFLMELKGNILERMVQAHKSQEQEILKQKNAQEPEILEQEQRE